MSAKLVVREISKRFERSAGTSEALSGVSLEVTDNQFLTVVGPSGCGKTTLLRIIAGLTPPTEGEVLVDGFHVSKPSPDRAMVFQQDALLPWRTVLGNVVFGLEMLGAGAAERRERGRELLRIVGLHGFEDHFPRELSGGMRQRVNLARALAVQPTLLLMDEPFAALDAQTREVMQSELLDIWARDRKTVVFVTHQIDEAVFLSDSVVVLAAHPGRVEETVTIDLPRPRELAIKRTRRFAEYVDHIWKLIEAQAFSSARSG